jgi:transcriptional regulator
LILRTLRVGPAHGHAIARAIEVTSDSVLQVEQGSLYPALHRLERRGWIKAKWGTSENNRRAKYYQLTKTGRKQLELEKDSWHKLTAAIAQILETA